MRIRDPWMFGQGVVLLLASIALWLISLVLVGCGSGSSGQSSMTSVSYYPPDSWPIKIEIEPETYIHLWVAVNGEPLRCIFDTGAPGIWLPDEIADHATVSVGNYERTNVNAYSLPDDKRWTGCLLGLPFFEGMTEYRIDLEQRLLEVR